MAPSLGDGKIYRGPRFLNDAFLEKKFPFSRPKFLMTFFRILITMFNIVYDQISSQEQPLFQKTIPLLHLFLLRTFTANPTTLLLKILGGTVDCGLHGSSPTSNFCGDRPPSPSGSPPLD